MTSPDWLGRSERPDVSSPHVSRDRGPTALKDESPDTHPIAHANHLAAGATRPEVRQSQATPAEKAEQEARRRAAVAVATEANVVAADELRALAEDQRPLAAPVMSATRPTSLFILFLSCMCRWYRVASQRDCSQQESLPVPSQDSSAASQRRRGLSFVVRLGVRQSVDASDDLADLLSDAGLSELVRDPGVGADELVGVRWRPSSPVVGMRSRRRRPWSSTAPAAVRSRREQSGDCPLARAADTRNRSPYPSHNGHLDGDCTRLAEATPVDCRATKGAGAASASIIKRAPAGDRLSKPGSRHLGGGQPTGSRPGVCRGSARAWLHHGCRSGVAGLVPFQVLGEGDAAQRCDRPAVRRDGGGA